MNFLNKIGDTFMATGKLVTDKAQETVDVINLKSQISTCEEVIRKNYQEIGKQYFEQYGENPEGGFEKQCEAIKNAQNGIKELQEKIRERKGTV